MKVLFSIRGAAPFLFFASAFLLVFFHVSDSCGGPVKEEGFPPHLAGINASEVDWKAKDTDYWRAVLSRERFRICRNNGTEFPYTGRYNGFYKEGVYKCSSCGLDLFSSEHKYDSRTGWPSFRRPIRRGAVGYKRDHSLGMSRTEIVCGRCGAHLGHVFDDGPKPTGKRYCVNSICLFHENPKRDF